MILASGLFMRPLRLEPTAMKLPHLFAASLFLAVVSCERHSYEETKVLHEQHGHDDHAGHGHDDHAGHDHHDHSGHDHGDHGDHSGHDH